MQFLKSRNSFYLVQTSSQCMQTGDRHLKKVFFRLVFLYFLTELKTYHLSYFYLQTLRYRHTDPSSMQDAFHMNFVIDLAHRGVSVARWQSIEAQNPKVWGSILHRDSEFFLCPTLMTRRRTSFCISLPSSKLTISLIAIYRHYIPRKYLGKSRTFNTCFFSSFTIIQLWKFSFWP